MRNGISGNTSQLNRDVATSLLCKSLFLTKLFSLISYLFFFLVDRYYEEKASNSLSKKGDCQTSSAVVS